MFIYRLVSNVIPDFSAVKSRPQFQGDHADARSENSENVEVLKPGCQKDVI
jgi:hypothetical protein